MSYWEFLSLRSLSLYFLDESSKNGSLTTATAQGLFRTKIAAVGSSCLINGLAACKQSNDGFHEKSSARPVSFFHEAGTELSPQLPFGEEIQDTVSLAVMPGRRAIEDDGLPFEALSDIAERESWQEGN